MGNCFRRPAHQDSSTSRVDRGDSKVESEDGKDEEGVGLITSGNGQQRYAVT